MDAASLLGMEKMASSVAERAKIWAQGRQKRLMVISIRHAWGFGEAIAEDGRKFIKVRKY